MISRPSPARSEGRSHLHRRPPAPPSGKHEWHTPRIALQVREQGVFVQAHQFEPRTVRSMLKPVTPPRHRITYPYPASYTKWYSTQHWLVGKGTVPRTIGTRRYGTALRARSTAGTHNNNIASTVSHRMYLLHLCSTRHLHIMLSAHQPAGLSQASSFPSNVILYVDCVQLYIGPRVAP